MWITDENGVIHRDEMLDSGMPEREIRRALASNEIMRVVPGRYVPSAVVAAQEFPAQYLYRLRCLLAATDPAAGESRPTLSHQSAAMVYGWKLLKPSMALVHVTNGRGSGGTVRKERLTHPGVLADDDVIEVGGVLLTCPERTAVDVALAAETFAQRLTVFDAALAGGASDEKIRSYLGQRRNGIAKARFAYRYADGDSESPGESWSRAQMIEAKLPRPWLQNEYLLDDGHTARCDFDWEGIVIGEFDGEEKYLKHLRPGEREVDVMLREKERELKLRALGLEVIRWTWKHLERNWLVAMLTSLLPRYGVAL